MVIAFLFHLSNLYIPEILQIYSVFSSTGFTLLTFFDLIVHPKLSFG